eukprot:g5089.t1
MVISKLLKSTQNGRFADLEYASGIERRKGPLTELEFLRDYVSRNKPVILTDCINEWPALQRWSIEYFSDVLGPKKLKIQTTPNGRADAVSSIRTEDGTLVECFVEPYEEQMTFQEFLALLNSNEASKIPYLQQQNDNLRVEFPELWDDITIDGFAWARDAFGGQPEAVNLWIGDHRNHYENIYVVLNGCKIFTLLPPCATNRLHFGSYLHAQYKPDDMGKLTSKITLPEQVIDWSPVDLQSGKQTKPATFGHICEASEKWPEFYSKDFPPPLVCEIHKGEVLYLPSLWYHHVEQRNTPNELVVAVNFWYDMKFDVHYAYHKFVNTLTKSN